MDKIKNCSDFFAMYVEGFRNLTWGRTLWVIILVKLFIMFAIVRVFLFPDILNSRFDSDKERSEYVSKELTKNHFN